LHLEDRYRQPSIVLVCLLRRPKRPTAHAHYLVNPLHLFLASCRWVGFSFVSYYPSCSGSSATPSLVLVVSRSRTTFERSKPGAPPPSEECLTLGRHAIFTRRRPGICCNLLRIRPMLACCVPQPRISNASGRANHSMYE
jgi:hypothetical protein